MQVRALDASHMMVILGAQEKQALGLAVGGPRWGSLHCRMTVARIFAAASSGSGFRAGRGARVSVRAIETPDGQCVLVFSAAAPARRPRRRVYTVKPPCPQVFRLETAGALLDAAAHLAKELPGCGARFFLLDGSYRAVLAPPLRCRARAEAILREYGALCARGFPAAAFVEEHGLLLTPG